jgi:hypothetical protein
LWLKRPYPHCGLLHQNALPWMATVKILPTMYFSSTCYRKIAAPTSN